VPLYETLGEDAIEYILDHSGARLVAVAAKRLGRVARALKVAGKAVEAVVYFGGEPQKEDAEVGAAYLAGARRARRVSAVAAVTRMHPFQKGPLGPGTACYALLVPQPMPSGLPGITSFLFAPCSLRLV
jgi:hypothetical protein